MLVELKKLNIINEGYKRDISFDRIYVNSNSIISITNYDGIKDFLIREHRDTLAKNNYSLVKINEGNKVEEIIALGDAGTLYADIKSGFSGKRILND